MPSFCYLSSNCSKRIHRREGFMLHSQFLLNMINARTDFRQRVPNLGSNSRSGNQSNARIRTVCCRRLQGSETFLRNLRRWQTVDRFCDRAGRVKRATRSLTDGFVSHQPLAQSSGEESSSVLVDTFFSEVTS